MADDRLLAMYRELERMILVAYVEEFPNYAYVDPRQALYLLLEKLKGGQ